MSLFEQIMDMSGQQPQGEENNLRRGIALAKVTAVKDPEEKGRVQLSLILAEGEKAELGWAFVAMPFAGKNYGAFLMPQIDDKVIVAFENGDPGRPFVIGSFWGGDVDAPQKLTGSVYDTFQIKTAGNNTITLKDKTDEQGIDIETPAGQKLSFTDKNQCIELSDKDKKNFVKIDSKNGSIEIECKSKLSIKVGDKAMLTMQDSDGSVALEGQKTVKIHGLQVDIKGDSTAQVAAQGELTLSAGGMTTVKGGVVKIN